MSLFQDFMGLFIILMFAFAFYMKRSGKSLIEVLREIKEGLK